jgi:acyl-CoA dehydrogenase
MKLFNPKNPDYSFLDEKTKNLMLKTIEYFETRGKVKLKDDDHKQVWYSDFLEFQKKEQAFAILMTPEGYGPEDSRWDSTRVMEYNNLLGFYGLAYWYTWQVSMLGLGPIWISKNEVIKKKAAKLLQDGEIFAFGLSEKEHGADLIGSDMELAPNGDGTYTANGDKFYIGNANKAAIVSTFGRVKGTGDFVFFGVDSRHKNYKLVQNIVTSQNYVAEYELVNYPITADDIISIGREAWDTSLATIAFCKVNLGWGSIGICEHSFYEAINHASKRKLFKKFVTDFPQVKQLFVDAYARLMAMKHFAYRANDYMRTASATDKRYLLFNPLVKMKVTMQGEDVINHLWDIIAAKGLNRDTYFEMAIRDIRMLPKLEGTVHVNMVLVLKFMENFFFHAVDTLPTIPQFREKKDDTYLFNQGATTKGFETVVFHDYKKVFAEFSNLPNVKIFIEQTAAFKELLEKQAPNSSQLKDLDFMLTIGEMFTLVAYTTAVLENSKLDNEEHSLIDLMFDVFVRDFTKYAAIIFAKSTCTKEQQAICLKIFKQPVLNTAQFEKVYAERILSLVDVYEMKA